MSEIIKVDTNDKLRTLLTDVLPYELPLWFSNFSMYQRFKTPAHLNAYIAVSGLDFNKAKGFFIPLDYLISRGENKTLRALSIMHPVVQLKVCDFYAEYCDLIEYYATRSQHSLRHPYRVSTKFYGKHERGTIVKDGVEGIDEDRIVASSFFKYKKYPFLYRFFESYEYHKLEKQFHSMLQVDISKCFPSIYTHSISWAVKSKTISKKNIEDNVAGDFDGAFDNLMQLANYRETNGIIVGPEVSRIFAEIILQKIDLNLVKKMQEINYSVSKDYDFRRYVDDYFFFFRSEAVKVDFIRCLESSLFEYKMYLNEAKTTIVARPFATKISLAKHALRHTIEACFNLRYMDNDSNTESVITLTNPSTKANKTISEIKMALANHKVEYSSISNYLFGAISRRVMSYLSKVVKATSILDSHLNWLLVDLDVLFFVHAMDIRIRPTDRLARLVHDILAITSNWSDTHKKIIHKKIFDHVRQAIDIFLNCSHDIIGIETLNLLIILTMLPEEHLLPEATLKDYFSGMTKTPFTCNIYFPWITFMLYVKDRSEYYAFHNELNDAAEHYLLKNNTMFSSAEYFMFYFDYLACPYIDINHREKILNDVKNITFISKEKKVEFSTAKQKQIVLNKDFIVAWRDKDYLKNSLEKKQFIFAYV